MSRMHLRLRAALTVALLAAVGSAESDPCTYNQQYCSCRMGERRQGVCWDKLPFGNCRRRYCKSGWTCSCHKRTHLCRMARRQAHIPLNPRVTSRQAPCKTRIVYGAAAPVLKLGLLILSVSPRGSQADACNQLALFHNGRLVANLGKEPRLLKTAPKDVWRRRSLFDKLELRAGDLVAFRFYDASYYCFRNLVRAVVNGHRVDSTTPGASLMYARKASPGWYRPDYDMHGKMASNEGEPDLTKWLPLRKKMLASPQAIVPNQDYWAPPDQSSADHRIHNWYFRFVIPSNLPTN